MAALASPAPEPSRPLAHLLAQQGLIDDLTAANRDGRIDTRNWRTDRTPAFHAGLHGFLSTSHHTRGHLIDAGWTQEVVRNQERFVSPPGMFDRTVKLALVGGQPDGQGIKVAHRGVETRLLIDHQGKPYASPQLPLPGMAPVHTLLDVVFVVSAVVRSGKGAERREWLSVFLAHPYDMSPDGTYLECDYVEEIARIDLDGPGGIPTVLPPPVPVDPLLGFRVRGEQGS